MKKILILTLPLLLLTSCVSNKLNNTVWHNVTMMHENGVLGNVGTSLVFQTDSTFIVYKGVSIDTTVIISPDIFASGKYEYKGQVGDNMQVSFLATKTDGTPYVYLGEYNKKSGIMILNSPNSKMKETYLRDPKTKVSVK